MTRQNFKIGLLIRSGPYQGRSSRDQLDIALAAASLDFEIDLFFTEEGILQLVADRETNAGHLPGGHKGWKALPGLGDVRAWAGAPVLSSLAKSGTKLLLPVEAATHSEMSARLAGCDRVMVI